MGACASYTTYKMEEYQYRVNIQEKEIIKLNDINQFREIQLNELTQIKDTQLNKMTQLENEIKFLNKDIISTQQTNDDLIKEYQKKYIQVANLADSLYEKNDLLQPDIFKTLMVEQAEEHEYILDRYDCTEFSKDLARTLKQKGWRAKSIFVRVDCDSGLFEDFSCNKYDGGHEIVEVSKIYIEATSGNIILPDDYKIYGIMK